MTYSGQLEGKNHINERLYINGREIPVLDNPKKIGIFVDVNESKNKPIQNFDVKKIVDGYKNDLINITKFNPTTPKDTENKNLRIKYLNKVISKEEDSPVTYLYSHFPEDKAIWDDLLSHGMSVDDTVKKAGMENYMSRWFESQNSRTTVFNPAMKYSPLKVTRRSDTIVEIRVFINCFVDQESKREIDANQEMRFAQVLGQSQDQMSSNNGEKIKLLDFKFFVEKGIREWAGTYKADGINDSFGKESEVQAVVEIIEGDGRVQINQQRYLNISLVKKLEKASRSSTVGYVNHMGWTIDFHGEMSIRKESSNDSISNTVHHEFGHVLGLNDATKFLNNGQIMDAEICVEIPKSAIMRYSSSKKTVFANDIEMILEAWKTDSEQNYMDLDGGKTVQPR